MIRTSPYAVLSTNQNPTRLTGGLIGGRYRAAGEVMTGHVLDIFADKDSFFHEVENFRIAAGEAEGEFRGNVYGDGDFYKLLEACVCFGRDISEYAALIARTQEPDGYISTKQIIASKHGEYIRHADQDDFEEYNFGHLFTLAAVHYRVTGSRVLLDVAEKAAEYLYRRYKTAIADKKAMTAVCPSHYMGLAALYRATGDPRWLESLEMAIQIRDYVENGTDDNQDAVKLLDQRVMHGHAVRATYLYAGLADLYLETGRPEYMTVLESCFNNLVNTKLYINGGLGALYTGASPFGDLINSKRVHQAFGYEYQLPNITAYNETCAALGGVFWAQRMLLATGEARYGDFIERVVYNLAFAAMNIKGDKYFYENMLRRTQTVDYFLMWPRERTDTFECFCCPTNLSRFIAEIPEYAYFESDDTLYAMLFMPCRTHISLSCGAEFDIEELTDYPRGGRIEWKIYNHNGVPFRFMARIPDWAGGGYRGLDIQAPVLEFDMTPRLIRANTKLEENEHSVCVRRGPMVYCMEDADLSGLCIDADARFEEYEKDICGEKVIALRTRVYKQNKVCAGLYEPVENVVLRGTTAEFIPYYAWDNSGFKEMRIWIPVRYHVQEG